MTSVTVHARIQVSAETLASVVRNAKKAAKERGGKADPAETLNDMITRFLDVKGFEAFVEEADNYGTETERS
ncbi:hypothetical protein OOT00_07025 [Desulfobotulus sp. H1]|uniref:Uncharacterized protein n=1 Tax=Desulfobotulus pelophilus TaxID=2823377 RepID=A0ABT3N8G0_9BACT|nr:hypothetical protein [Desulfobotulus pelophilus]MCW7753735.1 hypothetical protein [Desulfobotulus pelophilus]